MADVAPPAASALPDAMNEKVTTIMNPVEEQPQTNGEVDDAPVERQSAVLTNGHPETTDSRNGTTNGDATSYAAAVTRDMANPTRSTADVKDEDDWRYPPIAPETPHGAHERHAWHAAGIRFAPMQVPLVRRMQTAAVLFHCMSIGLLVSIFWFTIANPLSWPLLVPYLLHLTISTAATNGNLAYRSEYLRSLPLWRLFAGYFPMKLHKTHELDTKRKYVFGYHPHGIISHGAWCSFGTNALGFREKFPGITNTLLTLDSNFRIPFYRDWVLAMGLRSVSKESIWNTLTKGGPNNDGQGRAVTIVIGGARESLEAQPGHLRLILQGRKGFVKMALRTGADLVPVVAFGENDLYDQLSPKTHPMVHKIQMLVLKVFKFTVPALHGRGLLNYDVGLMPYRRPVNIVVGRPVKVRDEQVCAQPGQADIDELHERYVDEVLRIWEAYKEQFAPRRKTELQILP